MKIVKVLLLTLMAATAAGAQQRDTAARDAGYAVKTIALHRLSNTDAVMLLQPYLINRGTVSSTGISIRGVTVRATPATIAEMEKLLAQYDRSPATVTLQFQLVVADNSNRREPGLAGLDSVLRGSLKFTGYRLLSSTIASVGEETNGRVTMSGDGEDYTVNYGVGDVHADVPGGAMHLQVDLRRVGSFMSAGGNPVGEKSIFSTGVTIPDDHTVVLGGAVETARKPVKVELGAVKKALADTSATARIKPASDRALFLVVRAQIVATPTKRD